MLIYFIFVWSAHMGTWDSQLATVAKGKYTVMMDVRMHGTGSRDDGVTRENLFSWLSCSLEGWRNSAWEVVELGFLHKYVSTCSHVYLCIYSSCVGKISFASTPVCCRSKCWWLMNNLRWPTINIWSIHHHLAFSIQVTIYQPKWNRVAEHISQ